MGGGVPMALKYQSPLGSVVPFGLQFFPLALWSCSVCCSWWFLSSIQVEKYEITNSKKTDERSIFTSDFKTINIYLVYFSDLILPLIKNYFDHQDGAASQTLLYSLIIKTPGTTVIKIKYIKELFENI